MRESAQLPCARRALSLTSISMSGRIALRTVADAAGREERVIAVIGADIDEHHAGSQYAVQEGELVGLKRAADIEAKAVVVAQGEVNRGAAVPSHGDRHREVLLPGSLPQRAAPAGQPATLLVVLLREHPAGPWLQPRNARRQE